MATPIFHLTTAEEWRAAQAVGHYTRSTRDKSLAEVGFVHCSRGDQWPRVRDAIYGDVTTPLVLLEIDPDRLDVPVVEEPGTPGSAETFPHVYGPVPVTAVRQAIPLDRASQRAGDSTASSPADAPVTAPVGGASREDFGSLFLGELFRNAAVLVALLGCIMIGSFAGDALRQDGWGAVAGLVLGAGVGIPVARILHRRLRRTSAHQ